MTTPIKLTYEEALALLERAVQEKGEDYQYNQPGSDKACTYFEPTGYDENGKARDWEPGCIVGQVLSYLGVDRDRIRGTADDGYYDLNMSGVYSLTGEGDDVSNQVLEVDLRTQRLLADAQADQDRGETWGKAVATAKGLAEHDIEVNA